MKAVRITNGQEKKNLEKYNPAHSHYLSILSNIEKYSVLCLRRPGALFEKYCPLDPRKNFLLKGDQDD
jgi:hypothetical protein